MAFNINAQIILSQPKNLNNVTKNISKQLGKVTKIDLKIGNVRQLTTLNKQLTTLNNSLAKLNSGLSSTRGSVSALGGSFNKTAAGVKNASKAQNTLNSQIGKTNQSLQTQAGLVGTLGKRFGSVAKQAIAFGLISRPIYDLQRALTGAVKDAVAFEREIVRISQVTGRTVSQLDGLTSQITQLSKSLGISANELAETSRVIAQAGIRGKDLEQVLTALARSTLAPTFGRITDTTEGLIAAFGQFGLRGKDAEAVLGSLNKVSKEFAVEAEDLISVIRRTGGVFAQAAGDSKGTVTALQELTAVFTAVRSTTRESADTIAAGLRTIFSRIQRRSTINFLKQFGVDLTDTQGRFIGIFPAFDQLSKRLDTLIKQGDALTLSAIAEELGGIRQIGKLLPAIAQFDKARKALTEAQKGAVEGLGGDVAKALDTIDNRVRRIRESFNALIRQVFESDAFQGFAKSFLSGSQAIIDAASSIFKTIEPILPLLTALGTVKLGRAVGGLASGALGGGLAGAASTVTGSATAQNTQKTATAVVTQNTLINTTNSTLANMTRQLANLIQINNSGFNTLTAQAARGKSTVVTGFGGGRRRASGGAIPKFANGGRVYGPSHAAGGVIAELEGGEYVVPKKFARGGQLKIRSRIGQINPTGSPTSQTSDKRIITVSDLNKVASPAIKSKLKGLSPSDTIDVAPKKVQVATLDKNYDEAKVLKPGFDALNKSIKAALPKGTEEFATDIETDSKARESIGGFAFERFAGAILGVSPGGKTDPFDFKGVKTTKLAKIAEKDPLAPFLDAKRTIVPPGEIVSKALREPDVALSFTRDKRSGKRVGKGKRATPNALGGIIQKLATGDIVRANSVGVAILDPDDVPDGKAKVSVKDIESQIGFTAGTKRGFSGVGAALKKDNFTGSYNIVKQGLNKKTSERFNKALAEGLIKGVDFAASELSGDLGLGPTTIDQASKTKFIQSQRSALRGDLFEAVLSSLNNRGKFDNAVDFARPFDFPNGLQGPFADNFSKLPSKFVDAKSSVAAAPDSNIRGKIIREIAADVVKTDPNILAQKNRQTGGKASKKSPKQARGFGALTFASGGEVPVRISNGEMVVTDPKEVAANRGKLQSINKLATGGFASGTIAKGPGTGTSDSIYTTLPEGAFVVNAASTKKYLGLRRGGGVGAFRRGGLNRAGQATGAAQTTGGEAAGAGIGLLFAVQSLTASFGDASSELNNFVNVIGTAVFASQALGLNFQNIGALSGKLEGALGKIPGVGKNLNLVQGASSSIVPGQKTPFGKRIGGRVAGRLATFGGAGGTAVAAIGGLAGGAAIGKIIGDIAGPLIADSVTGKQEEVLGVKGSATTGQAQFRGSVEGGVKGAATGIGAGAGLGFVLGGPVGAAIGAAIGGVAGSIIGSEIGAANAVYQQEVFKAAKAFKGASDDVKNSLQAISQEATTTGFAKLAKDLENQNVKFGSAVDKFNNKFENEVTLAGESLSFLRDVTGQTAENGSTFFDGLDSFFGTSLSAANQAKQNSIKAFAEAGKLFNPEQLQGLKDSLNTGLEKFFAETDFSGIEGLDEASASAADKLQAAADAGNQLAQSLIRLQDETVRQTLIAQQQQLSQGNAQQRAAGAALTPLIIDPSILRNQQRFDQFIQNTNASIEDSVSITQRWYTDVLTLNRQIQAARDGSIGYAQDLKEQIDAQNEAAEKAGLYEKAVRGVTKEFDFAIKILKDSLAGLSFASKESSSRLSTLEANINAINAGTGQFQLQSFTNPFQSTSDAAIAEADRFFNFVETNFGITGADALRDFNQLRNVLPEIVEDTLNQAQAGELTGQDGGAPTGAILANSLREGLAAQGFQLPAGIEEFLVSGPGRQGDADDSVQAATRLEELLETGRIGEVLGQTFDIGTQSLEDFVDKINQSIKQLEAEIKVNVQQLKVQRELTKTLTDLNIAGKEREQQILEGSLRTGGRPDTIASAEANVRARSRAIGGSANVRELSARRERALQEQQNLAAQFEAGAIAAEDYKNEQIRLTNEIASTTEALNFLATETETYSAILKEAGKVTADLGALEGGLEKTIQAIASGDVGAQRGIVSDQQSIFAALQGVASIPQALQALQALGQEENRALVDAIAGRQDAGADLRQLLLRQLGAAAERGGGPVGAAVSNQLNAIAAFEKQQLDLVRKAEAVQERQATAAETIVKQNDSIIGPRLKEIADNNIKFNTEFDTAVNNFKGVVDNLVNNGVKLPGLDEVEVNTAETAANTFALENGLPQEIAGQASAIRDNYNNATSPWVAERERQLNELIKQATDANLTPEQRAAAQQQVNIANFAELERIVSENPSVLQADGKIDSAALEQVLKDTPGLFDKLNKSIQNFNAAVDQNTLQSRDPTQSSQVRDRSSAPSFAATPFANGGSIFQPRGTDTVPAMLTPGEFVIKKSSVDQYGPSVMEAINNGNAQVYAASGGRVGNGVLYRQNGGDSPGIFGFAERKGRQEGRLAGATQLGTVRGVAILQDKDGNLINKEGKLIGTEVGNARTLEDVKKSLNLRSRVDRFIKSDDARQERVRQQRLRQTETKIRQSEEKIEFLIDKKRVEQGEDLKYNTPEQFAEKQKEFEERASIRRRANAQSSDLIRQNAPAKVVVANLQKAGYQISLAEYARRSGTVTGRIDFLRDLENGKIPKGQNDPFQAPLSIAGVPGFDPNVPDVRSDLGTSAFGETVTVAEEGRQQITQAVSPILSKALSSGLAFADFINTLPPTDKAKALKAAQDAAADRIKRKQEAREKAETARASASARVAIDRDRAAAARRGENPDDVFDPDKIAASREEEADLNRARRERNAARAKEVRQRAANRIKTPEQLDGTFTADGGTISLGVTPPRSDAAERRERRAVNAFRIQFNRAILSGNYNAARRIAQRYISSGDISASTISSIKRDIDAGASARGILAPLYNKGGEVPIMAQSGEFVMNRQAVQRNGIGMLSRMNQGLPTFHSGGYVGGATQYRQAGGRIFGRNNDSPQSVVTVNGSDAAKELNNAIITGGETVKQSWQTLFDTVAQGLNSAFSQISTIPNQINATIAPVQIEGVGSFTDALAAQIVPKIMEQIAPLIQTNKEQPPSQGSMGV